MIKFNQIGDSIKWLGVGVFAISLLGNCNSDNDQRGEVGKESEISQLIESASNAQVAKLQAALGDEYPISKALALRCPKP
jgi:hypothetical protein